MAKALVVASSVNIDPNGPLAASVAESSLGNSNGFGPATVYLTPGTHQYAIGANTRFLYIFGTGGAGGGSAMTDANNQGGSGGTGAVISEVIAVPSNLRGSNIAVVVGVGGTGGAAGSNPGVAGGDSTIAALGRVAGGGGGGTTVTGGTNGGAAGLPIGVGFNGNLGHAGVFGPGSAVTATGLQYGYPAATSGAGAYNSAGGNATGGGDGAGSGFWAISAQ